MIFSSIAPSATISPTNMTAGRSQMSRSGHRHGGSQEILTAWCSQRHGRVPITLLKSMAVANADVKWIRRDVRFASHTGRVTD